MCLASTWGLYLVLRGSPAFLHTIIAFPYLHTLSSRCLDEEKESKYNYIQGTAFRQATLSAMLVFLDQGSALTR